MIFRLIRVENGVIEKRLLALAANIDAHIRASNGMSLKRPRIAWRNALGRFPQSSMVYELDHPRILVTKIQNDTMVLL